MDVVGEHGMVEAFRVRDRLGEHLIAEVLLKAAPRVCILATSREPVRAEGEWLDGLHSLELPPKAADLTADDLFVERAMASAGGFDLAGAEVPAVLEICRSLDGMPLALELEAARADAFCITV
jgi:predicted ATPase